MKGKPQIVKVDGREIGWPIIALVAGYKATWDKRYLDGAFEFVGSIVKRSKFPASWSTTSRPGPLTCARFTANTPASKACTSSGN